MASGYEKAEWEPVPVSGQASLALGIVVPRAVDWIMLTGGYAVTGIIARTSVQFLLG